MNDKDKSIWNHAVFKWTVFVFQILLLGISIIIPIWLGMKHVNTTGVISIAFDWIAMFTLILIFRNCCNGRTLQNTKEMMGIIIAVFLCVFFEVGIWVFDRLPDYRILNYVCNIGTNCAILVGSYMYFLFIRKTGDVDPDLFPWMNNVIQTSMIVGITAEVLNCIGGYFYVIDDAGIYTRSPYGSYLGYIPFLMIIIGSVLFIVRQKINWNVKLTYISYCIIPFLCSIWYTITECPPTFFVSAAMAILLIHGDIYVEQTKKTEYYELESAKKEAEHALSRNMLMLSQIKPHFLYNALGSIEVLCRIDPEKAGRAVHHFAHYLRTNMDVVNNSDTIPFSQELEHIRNYVWLEKMRFEDELEYREEIEVMDFRVPQLSVQPLIENAVKHGMMGNEDGVLHVILSVKETEETYVLSVCDDGCGFHPNQVKNDGRSHLGIESAKYSLQLLLNGTMNVESRIGSGTTVTITIPKTQKGESA